ncbi:MAG: tetratricopeptide repeat protein [Pseudomonadota bacterium]
MLHWAMLAIAAFLWIGPVGADFAAGEDAFERGDYKTALAELLPLAESGDALSQFAVGVIHSGGYGMPVDSATAAKWFRLAADQGHGEAQYALGSLYEWGSGVPQDVAKAASLYQEAADQDVAGAQYRLALLYLEGEGVTQDYVDAYMWMRLADDAGDADAAEARELMSGLMTPAEIDAAERMADGWQYTNP